MAQHGRLALFVAPNQPFELAEAPVPEPGPGRR